MADNKVVVAQQAEVVPHRTTIVNAAVGAAGVKAAYAPSQVRYVRIGADAAMVVHTPQIHYARVGTNPVLVTYSTGILTAPRESTEAAAVVYGTDRPTAPRSRAWTFTMDGHVFYVLDLAEEGTFLYDQVTGQWCEFATESFNGWNMRNGVVWTDGDRIVGGDTTGPTVWELAPGAMEDDVFRDVVHTVTGGVPTRSRTFHAVEALRISGSLGDIEQPADVPQTTLTMRFSDDNGKTWSDDYVQIVKQGDYGAEIAFRSLGSFMAPGRIFEISDAGGILRIDGADVFIDGFDDNG